MAFKNPPGRGIKALPGTKGAKQWEAKGADERKKTEAYEAAVTTASQSPTDRTAASVRDKRAKEAKEAFEKPASRYAKGGKVRGAGCATKGYGKAR